MEIKSRNTNTLMFKFISLINDTVNVVREDSRNGPVIRFREPVTICLTNPWERVNFSPTRDGNPFFHLIEAMAMLGNLNKAKFLTHFAKNMAAFSDDGETYNAFYGSRLRAFRSKRCTYPMDSVVEPQDQLSEVIAILRQDPLSRQAVALLWDPADLMYMKTKDKACNCLLVFSIDRGRLRMSSYNRSNDGIYGGVMGANIVHLSFFQEYVAQALGLPMGEWWHHSNNLHVYEQNEKWPDLSGLTEANYQDVYPNVKTEQLLPLFRGGSIEGRKIFDAELHTFLYTALHQFKNTDLAISPNTYADPFIGTVVVPVYNTWQAHKHGSRAVALSTVETIASPDWRVACMDWLERRYSRTPVQEVTT
jgi:thymidylate synthase